MTTKLADAETRAASHYVILQQHQQRKDMQEKKVTALQARLLELQIQQEASLAAVTSSWEAHLGEITKQADER